MVEPVVVYFGTFVWYAANDDGCFGAVEGVVVYVEPRSCNGGVVFAVSTAVHIEAVTQRMTEFDVVAGFVTTS